MMYQRIGIWKMHLRITGMLIFFYILLFLHCFHTRADNTGCRMMGDSKYPLLSKDGDFTIGTLFAIHSKETLPSFEFRQKPQRLFCSRFVALSR